MLAGSVTDFPSLNPGLDRAVLQAQFQRHGRIHIRRVLAPEAARRIHACLSGETAFDLAVNGGGESSEITAPTPQARREQALAAWRRAGLDNFQFLYDRHTLSRHGEAYPDPDHYWARVTSFLNGPDFLGLARAVTGLEGIAFADAQATLYRPGDFLTLHDDNVPGLNRQVAYVLSFTTQWRPEWGGLLEFVDAEGQVEAGYVPNFNSLRLFRVPSAHYVSCVAPFAGAGRYAITGWLRAR
jgi:Rps23 Pro-64 3,4-dihydroxylase Tpa1-like proline 4-hydroxylase